MASYHQMGNDSINLIFDENLHNFRGAILSPVNCTKDETVSHVSRMRNHSALDVIFDPQLYSPRSERGRLPDWDYFPRDVDTADLSSLNWWVAVVDKIIESASSFSPDAICSPAMVPRTFPDSYFEHLVEVSDYLTEKIAGSSIRSVMTSVIRMEDLSETGRALSIASILSKAKTNEIYMVILSDREPRREHNEADELKGTMRLIASLEEAGMHVLVGFCSTDLVLWKSAGATSCATGKFFNIRRFTLSRFDDPSEGGGQVPYWIEEALLAFVRQSDFIRIQQRGIISDASRRNPFLADIISKYSTNKPWIALSWRQYMWWFADVESRLTTAQVSTRQLVEIADHNWGELEKSPRLYMEERANDGSWTRQWLRALEEFSTFK